MAPGLSRRGQLVGRHEELARLTELVGADHDPESSMTVLVAGDAGVGKTRLLSELADQSTAAGWRVLVGHCLDFGDSELAYLPFTEIFGRLSAEPGSPPVSLSDRHPAVSRLLPGRRMLSGSSNDGADRVDRADLFESVHATLSDLAQDEPLLVIIEDVHWADRSTRELLSFLFARQFGAHVAIVASYRSDDIHRKHPLRATVAEWARLPGVVRLQLPPLAEPDVRALVRAIHPA
ncbi:MAG: AAA family ATPase, partial [Nocardioidaceae bacterium]